MGWGTPFLAHSFSPIFHFLGEMSAVGEDVAEAKCGEGLSQDVKIVKYSDKSFVVMGEGTRSLSAALKTIGSFNRNLKTEDGGKMAGWIVPASRKAKIDEILANPLCALEKAETSHAASSEVSTRPPFTVTYSEKALAVFGDTKKYKEQFKALNGRFGAKLKYEDKQVPGWVFSAKRKKALQTVLSKPPAAPEAVAKAKKGASESTNKRPIAAVGAATDSEKEKSPQRTALAPITGERCVSEEIKAFNATAAAAAAKRQKHAPSDVAEGKEGGEMVQRGMAMC